MSNLKCQINFKAQMCMLKRVKCEKWKVLRVMDYPFCIFSLSTQHFFRVTAQRRQGHGSTGSPQVERRKLSDSCTSDLKRGSSTGLKLTTARAITSASSSIALSRSAR